MNSLLGMPIPMWYGLTFILLSFGAGYLLGRVHQKETTRAQT